MKLTAAQKKAAKNLADALNGVVEAGGRFGTEHSFGVYFPVGKEGKEGEEKLVIKLRASQGEDGIDDYEYRAGKPKR